MAARVLIPGLDTQAFDIDIEAAAEERTFVADGPDIDAFKAYLERQGGGFARCRFDLSCDLGTLRDCSMSGDPQASGATFVCVEVEPPPASS
jgi:hypothetical protein